jgi:serine/threonine-protein kinase
VSARIKRERKVLADVRPDAVATPRLETDRIAGTEVARVDVRAAQAQGVRSELPANEIAKAARSGPAPSPARLPRLGPFQLDLEIGRGAMGRVYRATDVRTGATLAVKTLALTREFAGYALTEARDRFQREAQAALRLNHPDIVKIFDAGEEEGLAYIAMELLQGSDLTVYARGPQRMAVRDVLIVGTRVAAALAHAHTQGVVHRDIKPANVMVDFAHDRVKVMDFGIARISDAARTRTGLVLGSPLYMSPEQLTGRRVDGRSDIYSLGLVLFQLLCGRLPIEAGSMGELMRAAVDQTAPSVREFRPELPEVLADVVALALQKRMELRYADGRELAHDLQIVAAKLALHPESALRPVHEVAQLGQSTSSGAGARDRFVHNDQA